MVRDGTDPDLAPSTRYSSEKGNRRRGISLRPRDAGVPEARIFGDQARRALELVEERISDCDAGLVTVVRGGLVQFFLRIGTERPAHASFARTRANA